MPKNRKGRAVTTSQAASPVAICRHCSRPLGVWRRRGLCSPCYYTPAIRRRYPAGPGGGDATTGRDFDGPARRRRGAARECMPPLVGSPGSEDRIAELERRFARQHNLFAVSDYVRVGPRRLGGPHIASGVAAVTMADVEATDDWARFVDANDEWADGGD